MKKSFATVVVTYNRKQSLVKNINCLLNQTKIIDKIFIIDNASTDGTYEYLVENEILSNQSVEYIRLNENLGGSGGFYEGIKIAYNNNFDWIWGMDDDAYPEKDALEKLTNKITEYPNEYCFWSNCNNDNDFNGDIKKVNTWMFVGFLINKEVIAKVGLPVKDYFIYHDDTEYAYRIIKSGFNIIKVKDSLIDHGDLSSREFYENKFLNRQFKFPKMPDWKLYYYARNGILKYSYKDKNKYKQMLTCFKELVIIFIVNKKQFYIYLKGVLHGILGKKGKIVTP